jgi:hypothetical protein
MWSYVVMLMRFYRNFLYDCGRKVHIGRSPEMVQLEQTGYFKYSLCFSDDYLFHLLFYST